MSDPGSSSPPSRPQDESESNEQPPSTRSSRSGHTPQSNHSRYGTAASQPEPQKDGESIMRPSSLRSSRSARSTLSKSSRHSSSRSSELTPLLGGAADRDVHGEEEEHEDGASRAAHSLRSIQGRPGNKATKGRRWPSLVAFIILTLVVVLIMGVGFFAPAIVREYATEAMVFEPTNLSIDSFTTTGVRARVQGTFALDGSKVKKKPVRDIGRAGTYIAKEIESGESTVEVYLPEYGNLLLGTATIPRMVMNIRDGHTNVIDFLTDVEPGDISGMRQIANDWLEGRLGQLRVLGKADVGLKSGIFHLGSQGISESLVFEGHDLPSIPNYTIRKLNFRETDPADSRRGMIVDVAITVENDYPVRLSIPPLGFEVLVPNCLPDEPFILLAEATSLVLDIEPREDVNVSAAAIVRGLPETLTTACPNSHSSPLDLLLGKYIHGKETTIYIRGSDKSSAETPGWIADLLSSVTVPLPFPGHTFDNLIKNFSLADVHFSLPDPLADPDTPEASPRLSALVEATVGLPEEMNFEVDVSRVRADADVFYYGRKLGHLNLRKWQSANSSRVDSNETQPILKVRSVVKDAPLQITDDDVFAEVVQAMVFGGKGVVLGIKAEVDVDVESALGQFIVREISAEGQVIVKPLSGGLESLVPKIGSLEILKTTRTSILLQVKMNFTNPTEYSAKVPFVDINILNNDTVLGHATVKDIFVRPGQNNDILAEAVWDPVTASGQRGQIIGRELLSQYISAHNGSFPSQPALSHALSSFEVRIPTPRLFGPEKPGHGDGDEDGDGGHGNAPRFIEDATVVPALLDILYP
ncbi:MAG: hypothetical protein M1819_006561 [Sarea resinae]|nr:MAG: hypothetical protein M1819_006561 [Sarea resinae]